MVAKIISGKSLMGALNYNENKVKVGKAELVGEGGYAENIDMLTFNDKLFRLTDLAAKNERVKTNAVHISLNFAVGEVLEKDKLNEIAFEYMDRIGFSGQLDIPTKVRQCSATKYPIYSGAKYASQSPPYSH